MEDDFETQRLVKMVAYCSLGLSIINLAILMMLGMMLLKGTV